MGFYASLAKDEPPAVAFDAGRAQMSLSGFCEGDPTTICTQLCTREFATYGSYPWEKNDHSNKKGDAICLPAPPPPPPLPPPPPVPPGECRSEKSEHGDSTKPGCSPWCKLKDCTVWCKCTLKGPPQCDGGPPPAVTGCHALALGCHPHSRGALRGLGSTVGTCGFAPFRHQVQVPGLRCVRVAAVAATVAPAAAATTLPARAGVPLRHPRRRERDAVRTLVLARLSRQARQAAADGRALRALQVQGACRPCV